MSFAAGTQQRAESLDSNLRQVTSNNNNRSSVQSNSTSDGNRPRSTSGSKALLTLALMEAQTAVQLDNDSNITGALEAYQRAVTLLNRVMNTTSSSDEQGRLRTINPTSLDPTDADPTNANHTFAPIAGGSPQRRCTR
ncbi:hypothetical protein BGZ81_002256 [Podila clonocystis]|nr:hypothetical protein BGZ81_002256 [Podila clonocystis]